MQWIYAFLASGDSSACVEGRSPEGNNQTEKYSNKSSGTILRSDNNYLGVFSKKQELDNRQNTRSLSLRSFGDELDANSESGSTYKLSSGNIGLDNERQSQYCKERLKKNMAGNNHTASSSNNSSKPHDYPQAGFQNLLSDDDTEWLDMSRGGDLQAILKSRILVALILYNTILTSKIV